MTSGADGSIWDTVQHRAGIMQRSSLTGIGRRYHNVVRQPLSIWATLLKVWKTIGLSRERPWADC